MLSSPVLICSTANLRISLDSRSMSRQPRGPKRSPTPTSATFPPQDGSQPPPVPTAPSSSGYSATSGPPGQGKPLYLCSPFVEAALVKGNFKTIVMLPKYVDIMEWVAVNSKFRPPCGSKESANTRPPCSLRILHEPERILRCANGMLHATVMPVYVC